MMAHPGLIVNNDSTSRSDVDDKESGSAAAPLAAPAHLNSAAAFHGWQSYPEHVPAYDAFTCPLFDVQTRFDVFARESLDSSSVVVDVIDLNERPTAKCSHHSFFSAEEVEFHLALTRPAFRIISLFRKHSLSPLLITRDLFLKTLHYHAISPICLDLLFSFRCDTDLAEKGQAVWSSSSSSIRGSTGDGNANGNANGNELCYQVRYMERNEHLHGQRWSERQMGVYHRFAQPSVEDVMLLIHAGLITKAQTRMQATLALDAEAKRAVASPLPLHILLLTTYTDGWRAYLSELGGWCLKRENRFLTVPLNHPALCFQELQEMRDFESKLLSARASIDTTLAVIRELELCGLSMSRNTATATAGTDDDADDDEANKDVNLSSLRLTPSDILELRPLRIIKQKYLAFQRSVSIIQARTRVVAQLVSDGLNQQSQQTANSIADSSHALTLKTLHDSYVVKVVTVITVVYLPMQGVATFFGMNVTDLDEETNRFHFADNWWLFLATAIPLTLVTLVGLALAMKLEGRRKREKGA